MTETYERTSEALERLTPQQRAVTQGDITEPPDQNEFWSSAELGNYVDVVSGGRLFASIDKLETHRRWPRFTIPLELDDDVELCDTSHGVARTEVRSARGNSHLGHLFPNGSVDAGGMNSAALRSFAAKDFDAEGYGRYGRLFASDVQSKMNTRGVA